MSELVCYANTNDGFIHKAGATFAAAHDALVGTVVTDDAAESDIGIYTTATPAWGIERTFLYIDTSALPTDAIIIKAVLSIYVKDKYISPGYDFDVVVQNGQPTYPHTPLVAGDFLYSHYSGDGGSVNTADITDTAYNDIELSAVARRWIKGGGITKLCLRSDDDIDEVAYPASKNAYIDIGMKEKGDAYRAKLTITYAEFASVESTVDATATASAADIAKTGGKRTLEINNHLIQTTVVAQAVADAYLADYKDQKTKLRITKPTPPPFEVGDTIKVKI